MKNEFIEYVDGETVPDELVQLAFYAVKHTPNLFPKKAWVNWNGEFSAYAVPTQIREWAKSQFDFLKDVPNCNFSIQTLNYNIPIHIDRNRAHAFNYLFDTGGDNVVTAWYDTDENKLFQTAIELNRWHLIKTDIKHGIHGIHSDRLRVALSINLYEPHRI